MACKAAAALSPVRKALVSILRRGLEQAAIEAQYRLHFDRIAMTVCRSVGLCHRPRVHFGFMNTQHLTDDGPKKAALGQLLGFFDWSMLALCEVMTSAADEAHRAPPPKRSRPAASTALVERRDRALAEYVGHHEFTRKLHFEVVDAYRPERYHRHDRAKQLHYGWVVPRHGNETWRNLGLQPELIEGADASGRVPWRLQGAHLDVLVFHAPSGQHPNARRLVHHMGERLKAEGRDWVLVGDLNCSPTEFRNSSCQRGASSAICTAGAPHAFETSGGIWVHCPGAATRATGTLDFAVSNRRDVTVRVAIGLAEADELGFDHAGIDVRLDV